MALDDSPQWPDSSPVTDEAPTHDAPLPDGDASASGVSESAPAWEEPVEPQATGSLAAKVVGLRVLEDEIATLVGEAERALRTLESERTLEDAGFHSAEEFAERVASQIGLLREMRKAKGTPPAATGRVRRRSPGRGSGDLRARRTRALAAIEQAMVQLREFEVVLRGKVDEARALLSSIDQAHAYAECGYASFDEFLELAIEPSPILTKCLTVLGELPPPPESETSVGSAQDEELPSFADPPAPRPVDDGPPALFELQPEPVDELVPEGAAPSEAPDPAARPLPARSALIVSVVMALASAVLGAAVGARSAHPLDSAEAAEIPASPSAAPAASHRPAPAAQLEPKPGVTAQVTSLPYTTPARRGHDEKPAPAASAAR